MKGLIVLAAGRAKRLGGASKCLMRFDDYGVVLDRLLEPFLPHVDHVRFVVGYKRDKVMDAANEVMMTWANVTWDFVVNPEYATTQTAASLDLGMNDLVPNSGGRTMLGFEGVYVTNADLVIAHPMFSEVIRDMAEHGVSTALLDPSTVAEEEVKAICVEGGKQDGKILRIGKGLEPAECRGETVGIYFLSPPAAVAFHLAYGPYASKLYYEDLFDKLIDESDMSFKALEIGEKTVIEFDTPEDVKMVEALFAELNK